MTSLVYAGTTLFWIFGATCVLLKPQFRLLDELLTYGRLRSPTSKSLPQSYTLKDSTVWTSLYLFGFIFSTLISYVIRQHSRTAETPLSLTLFQFQTARRLFDCVAIHRFSATRRMPVHLFLAGLSYYVVAPLTYSLRLAPALLQITPAMRVVIVSDHL